MERHSEMGLGFVADSAQIGTNVTLSDGVMIWDLAQVREGASIGSKSVIGRGAYVDHDVVIGSRCKVQNLAQLFYPARLGTGVFIGPGAILANDSYPRAVTPSGSFKDGSDWSPTGAVVEDGASVGAGAVILGGVTIGQWAVVGAGATVTRDVPRYRLAVGTPARCVGWVGKSGLPLQPVGDGEFRDPRTGERFVEHTGTLEGFE